MKENAGEHYSDRFIPSRASSRIEPGFSLLEESHYSDTRQQAPSSGESGGGDGSDNGGNNGGNGQAMLNMLLRSELLGIDSRIDLNDSTSSRHDHGLSRSSGGSGDISTTINQPNLFRFKTPLENMHDNDPRSIYDLSPVKGSNKKYLLNPHKESRKVSKVPYKVLDAPALQDDFYLNLVDW
jgi:cell division cycle 20-like protein 1, cofactor of APC complex